MSRAVWLALAAILIGGLAGCGGGGGGSIAFPQQLVGIWSLQREGPSEAALATPDTPATLTVQSDGAFTYAQGSAQFAGTITLTSSRATTYEGTCSITESSGGDGVPQVGDTAPIRLLLSTDGNTLTMTTDADTADQWVQEWTLQAAAGFPSSLAGTWTGQWNNATYQTQGGASMTVAVNETDKTAQFTMNTTGDVLGGSSPGAVTFSATYDDNSVTGSASSTAFGDLTFQINNDGTLAANATNLPNPAISAINVTGNVTAQTMTMNYTVVFAGGVGTANGVVTLTKQ